MQNGNRLYKKYALFCNLHLDFEKTYSIMKIAFTIKLCIIEAIQSFDLSVLNAIERKRGY